MPIYIFSYFPWVTIRNRLLLYLTSHETGYPSPQPTPCNKKQNHQVLTFPALWTLHAEGCSCLGTVSSPGCWELIFLAVVSHTTQRVRGGAGGCVWPCHIGKKTNFIAPKAQDWHWGKGGLFWSRKGGYPRKKLQCKSAVGERHLFKTWWATG